jgi:hypothetical protein
MCGQKGNELVQFPLSSKEKVSVIVACVKSKRLVADQERCLSTYSPTHLSSLVEQWVTAIEKPVTKLPVRSLYKGGSWSFILSASSLQPTFDFYVASAGCGLVSFDQELPGYQASFSEGPDQAARAVKDSGTIHEKNQRWWDALAETGLGFRFDGGRFLGPTIVCCSEPYMMAMAPALTRLADDLGPQRLLLISNGLYRLVPKLEECRLTAPSARAHFNVTQASLNARILKWAIGPDRQNPPFSELRLMAKDLHDAGSQKRSPGDKLSDLQVIEWIDARLGLHREHSATSLLRELRASGLACEQSRFAKLVNLVRQQETGT